MEKFKFEDELRESLALLEKGKVRYDFSFDLGLLRISIISAIYENENLFIKVYPSIGGERLLTIGDHFKEKVPLTTKKILEKFMEIIDLYFHIEKREIYRDEHEELIEEGYFLIKRK